TPAAPCRVRSPLREHLGRSALRRNSVNLLNGVLPNRRRNPVNLRVVFMLLTTSCFAESLITIKCQPPYGPRLNITAIGKDEVKDGLDGVAPTFVYSDTEPKSMIVLFPSVKAAGPTPYDNATKAIIIVNKPDQISALELMPSEVWVYSFFPKLGKAIF